jgi:hypothetical protein
VKLNAAENSRLESPAVQGAMAKLGLETHTFSQKEFADLLIQEQSLWGEVARVSGVHLE